jgi:hypothetical protein
MVERGYFDRDKKLGWKLKPNINIIRKDGLGRGTLFFSTNRFGFRDTPGSDPEKNIDVIVLGDSFVQGYWLNNQETIPYFLGGLTGLNVFNGGVGGYSTDQQYTLLKHLISENEPKLVVLYFFVNDLPYNDKNLAWGMLKPKYEVLNEKIQFELLRYDYPLQEQSKKILNENLDVYFSPTSFWREVNKSFLEIIMPFPDIVECIRLIRVKIGQAKQKGFDYQLHQKFYEDPGSMEKEWDLAFQFLNEMNRLVEKAKAKFVVFFIPEGAQILNDYEMESELNDRFSPQDYFLKKCESNKIICLDPRKRLLEKAKTNDIYLKGDGHFSPSGTFLVAEIMADFMKALK